MALKKTYKISAEVEPGPQVYNFSLSSSRASSDTYYDDTFSRLGDSFSSTQNSGGYRMEYIAEILDVDDVDVHEGSFCASRLVRKRSD